MKENLLFPFKGGKIIFLILLGFLMVYHLLNVIAFAGPPIITGLIAETDGSYNASNVLSSIDSFSEFVSKEENLDKDTVIFSLYLNIIVSLLFIAGGLASIFLKKKWFVGYLIASLLIVIGYVGNHITVLPDYFYFGFFGIYMTSLHVLLVSLLIVGLIYAKRTQEHSID